MEKGNLLLVDDEVMILKRVKMILEDHADNVFTAQDGPSALEILKKETVHCIICDINMPKMNGVEVIKNIRESGNEVPFIFYTGHGSQALMMEAVKYGAYDFLDKPNLEGLEEITCRGLKEGMNKGATIEDPASFESEFSKLLKKIED